MSYIPQNENGFPLPPAAAEDKDLIGYKYYGTWNTSPNNPNSGFADWRLEMARRGWLVKVMEDAIYLVRMDGAEADHG